MTSYSVEVEFDSTIPDDTAADLVDALTDVHGATGTAPSGNLSVILTIEATNVPDATARAIRHAQDAVTSVTHCPALVTGVATMTEAEFDRRLADEPTPSDLAGQAEACDILGISADTLETLADELAPHIVQTLAAGPLYRASGVRAVAPRHPLPPLAQELLDLIAAPAYIASSDASSESRDAAAAITRTDGDRATVGTVSTPIQRALVTLIDRGLVERTDSRDATLTGVPNPEMSVRITARGRLHAQPGTTS